MDPGILDTRAATRYRAKMPSVIARVKNKDGFKYFIITYRPQMNNKEDNISLIGYENLVLTVFGEYIIFFVKDEFFI